MCVPILCPCLASILVKDKLNLFHFHCAGLSIHIIENNETFLARFSGDWWAGYGYEIPTLQRAAIRILSQPCSSHWCRWNWTTFGTLHGKKRNRVEQEKMNDLVFVHCNLWLQALSQTRNGKSKPISFDEIDVSSDWPTELDPSAPLLDDSWLDNLPLENES